MSDVSLQDIAAIADEFEANELGAASGITWHSTSRTDVGRVRHINEDAFLDSPEQRLWVVADGMGGHSRGDYASGAVVRQLQAFPHHGSLLINLKDLEDRLQAANEQCRNAFRNKQPGTTVATMLAHGNYCFFLWSGDSRIYRMRDSQLEQLTQDHTVAQQKLARGEISAEEAESHHQAHVLTQAVGIREQVQLDLGFSEAQSGDRYMICSDGLYTPLEPEDLQNVLSQGSPQEACQALVNLAMERGCPDNITVIVIEASSGL